MSEDINHTKNMLMTTHKRLRYLLASGLMLLGSIAFGQAPYITYNTPINIYTVGTAITNLVPVNTGGAVPATTYATVSTFAGSTAGTAGFTNNTGTLAKFNSPRWIAIDGSGTQYVADAGNNEIRKITSAGAATLLAGSTTGLTGLTNATGTAALFNGPYAITYDGSGNLYVADFTNNEIREVTTAGVVTLLAGSTTGLSGLANGTGTAASFNTPAGIVYDPVSGAIYIADFANNQVRKMTTAGVVTLFAGSATGASGATNGTGSAALFNGPNGIAVDASGNVYVADQNNNEIREITPAGVVTLFAGSATGASGTTDGTGSAALFLTPRGLCVDASGNLYVTDSGNNTIRMATTAGVVTTIAGTAGTASFVNGVGTAATFDQSRGISVDPTTGNLYIADYVNNVIRKMIATGYSISPALPAGLTFTSSTGTISGTPTAASAATDYTITGFNVSGSSSTVINIACGTTDSWLGKNTTAWNTGTNWSTGAAPGVNDAVSIGVNAYTGSKKEPLITGAVTVGSITFGNNGGSHTLTVTSPGALTIGGNLTVPTAVTPTILGTGAINIAPGATVNITGTGKLTITSPLSFTLKSDATGSASIGQIVSTSLAGTAIDSIHVERYITGGTIYRGYRLMSSPVYAATVSSNNVYSINYLHDHVFLTGTLGTTNGFDRVGNPTIYLFREDQKPSNATFTSGNFWGISKFNVTSASHANYNYYLNGGSTAYNLPVGNGFMFFFRGDRTTASPYVTTTTPVAATLTATGTLNTGQVIVHDWYTPASANLGWTNATANSAVRGFNLVGNPYASSIDWEQYNTTTSTTGIYTNIVGGVPGVGNTIYELNPATNNYDTYQKGGVFTNHGSRTIASGQGFFVLASNIASPELVFNESAKTTTLNTGLDLFMATGAEVASLNNANIDQHLRLQIAMDSVNTDDIYIGFASNASPQFVDDEDAPYKAGTGKVKMASRSSDDVLLAINKMPLPGQKQATIALFVTAGAYGTYKLNMTELKGIPQIYEVWLMDAYKNDSLDMRHNTTYAFDITADSNSYGNKRFQLVIRQNPALGLHLLNFTATKEPNGAQVVWKTENEQDYTNFTVERSTDNGVTFDVLGGFASDNIGTYSFLDKRPATAANQYRLKLQDLNGNITYSNTVTLMYANSNDNLVNNNLSIYPNPAKSTLNLNINQSFGSTPYTTQSSSSIAKPLAAIAGTVYGIKIVSSTGSVMKAVTTTAQDWQTDVSSLTPGTYIIQVINNSNNSVVGKGTFVKL